MPASKAKKVKSRTPERPAPETHHLDRRAGQIVAHSTGDDDDLLDTEEVAAWLGISIQWLCIGRSKRYGPKFVNYAPRRVKYRRGDVKAWLVERTFACTKDYPDKREPGR